MTESLSDRNQSTDLLWKSMEWFLYDKGVRHEKVKSCVEVHLRPYCDKVFSQK